MGYAPGLALQYSWVSDFFWNWLRLAVLLLAAPGSAWQPARRLLQLQCLHDEKLSCKSSKSIYLILDKTTQQKWSNYSTHGSSR